MKRYILAPIGLFLLILFVELGLIARAGPLPIDTTIALWAKSHRTPRETANAHILSAITTPIVVLIVSVLIILFSNYWTRSWYPRDFVPIALVVATAAIATVSKSFFGRPRPGAGLTTLFDFEPGYPSSHTVFIGAAGFACLFLLRRYKLAIVISVCVLGSVVGIATVTQGMQWITDVIGGTFLSWGLFLLFYVLDDWLAERESSHR